MKMKRVVLWIASFIFVVTAATSIGSFFPQDTALMAGDCGSGNNADQTCTCTPPQTKTATPFGSGTRSGFYYKCTTPATPPAGGTTAPAGGTTTPATGQGDADATGTATGTTKDDGETCAVEKIGWILCPVIEAAAHISDSAFEILGDNFLRVDPELFDDDSGTKVGWEVARNLANIMFIIAFLIIIFSQVTGRGLNNYGIKKMLPRLIIAAIAVNVSYYICQLAVDLTNILGYEIQNALAQISNTVGPSVFGQASNTGSFEGSSTGGIITLIAVGALAGAAVVFFMLPTLIGLIPLILITVLTIIIILLLRKALIVLLIVISPIAFVMYLLPNTEKYFSKWMSMFGKLLMVFPIVGMLFGAGQLASTIILVSGADGNQAIAAAACDPDNAATKKAYNDAKKPGNSALCGEGSVVVQGGKDGNSKCFGTGGNCGVDDSKTVTWTLGLVAMGVAVAPLLAVWGVLQGALSAAGAIGGRISTAVGKAGKPMSSGADALGKLYKDRRTEAWQNMQTNGLDGAGGLNKYAGRYAKKKGDRALRQARTKQALDNATNHQVNKADNVKELVKNLSQAEQDKALRAVQSQEDHHAAEETKNALTAIEYSKEGKLKGAGTAFDNALANNGDMTQAKAAVTALMSTGEAGIDSLAQKLAKAQAEANRTGDHEFANNLKEYMMQAHGNVKDKNAAIHAWATSTKVESGTAGTVNDFAADASTYAKLNDKQFSTQTQASFESAGALAALSEMSTAADGKQESRAYRLLTNNETNNELNDAKRRVVGPRSTTTR